MRIAIALLGLMVAPAMAQDIPPAFNKCAVCHNIGEGAINKVGPALNGIVDQPAGTVNGYNYSIAMVTAREAGLVWSRAALTRFFKNPRHALPGTSMAFAGERDREDIDAIIDYLAGFDRSGATIAP